MGVGGGGGGGGDGVYYINKKDMFYRLMTVKTTHDYLYLLCLIRSMFSAQSCDKKEVQINYLCQSKISALTRNI